MKEITTVVYEAEDGKKFTDQGECEAYEKELIRQKRYTQYFEVGSCQDLNEGRGFQVITAFKLTRIDEDLAVLALTEFLAMGRPLIQYVQGVDPVKAFYIQKRDELWWKNGTVQGNSWAVKKVRCLDFRPPSGLVEVVQE